MEPVPVDLDAKQIARWLLEDERLRSRLINCEVINIVQRTLNGSFALLTIGGRKDLQRDR